jgi:hypothetical protein
MTHLMLTSALLFALLAVVAIAIGASLGIARDLMVDEVSESAIDAQSVPTAGYAVRQQGLAARQGPAGRQGPALGQGLAVRQGLVRQGLAVRYQDPAAGQGAAGREGYATRLGHGLAEDFGLGLQHATHFAQDPGRSFSRDRSFHSRV